VLTETEQEIALIESMLWTAPIIADVGGKGGSSGGGGGGGGGRGGGGVGDDGSDRDVVGGRGGGRGGRGGRISTTSDLAASTAEHPRRRGNEVTLPWHVQPAASVSERLVDASISL